MARWRRILFSHAYKCGDKTLHLLPLYGRAGILKYSEPDLAIVTYWEGAPGGILLWKNQIAQIYPEAGVPPELVMIRVLNEIRRALGEVGKLQLFVE